MREPTKGLTSVTLPMEEYQSMLDEMKKLKEDNSMLCRGANVIKVLKVDALFKRMGRSKGLGYYQKLSFDKEYSDDVVEKFKNDIFKILNDKESLENRILHNNFTISNLQNTLEEKGNQITELENKKGLGFIMFMVGCFVGGMLMSM